MDDSGLGNDRGPGHHAAGRGRSRPPAARRPRMPTESRPPRAPRARDQRSPPRAPGRLQTGVLGSLVLAAALGGCITEDTATGENIPRGKQRYEFSKVEEAAER